MLNLGDGRGPLAAEVVSERVHCPQGVVAVFGITDLGQHATGGAMRRPGQRCEDVGH
jgi:hypothetical protein